uniref:Uncharacterized protein n=1 Tax=Arundo donax TaxID=35708 RepID=A0A0A9GYS8_ARUDO
MATDSHNSAAAVFESINSQVRVTYAEGSGAF